MTTQAWVFLGITWSIILVATGYCFAKLLSSNQQFNTHEDEPPQGD